MSSDVDRLIDLVLRRTTADAGAVRDDVRRLKQYRIDDESIMKALTLKHGDRTGSSLLDVPGVTLTRAGLLIANGIEDPASLAMAGPSDVVKTDVGSESFAEAIVEAATIVRNESPILDTLREATDVDDRHIISTLRPLVAAGIPPSQAVDDVVAIMNQDPSVMEICEFNSLAVYRLRKAGYETINDIAAATTDELTEIQHVGDASAERARSAARRESDHARPDDETNQSVTEDNDPADKGASAAEQEPEMDTSRTARSASSQDTQVNNSDVTDNAETEPTGVNLRLLLVGSARPNIEDNEDAGIRIRAVVENSDYDLCSFDAVVYTGFVPPTPHHEQLNPEQCFREIHDQLDTLASQLPVYYITGDYGWGDHLKVVYDGDTYAGKPVIDPFVQGKSDLLTYIPTHETTDLQDVHLTQNPAIASGRENCVLVTPDFYPELWNDHDSLAYVAGGQLPGRYIKDSIAPMFSIENVGPKRPDAAGGVHAVTITDTGIESHDLIPLGDSGLISCPDHIDRGLQFAHDESRCLFCYNEDQYFKEWLQLVGGNAHRIGRDFDVKEAVEYVVDAADFSPDQVNSFRAYVARRLVEDYVGRKDERPAINGRRRPDSALLPDPRDVYNEAALIASDLLRIPPHERAAYFGQYDVSRVKKTLERAFEEVAPPIPDDMTVEHAELDKAAFNREALGGEWLVFPKRRGIGTVWERTLELIADGQLYDAHVGTAWHHEARNSRSERYYLAAAVPNYFNVDDVRRVGEVITTEDIVADDALFFFKPLLYTRLGINNRNAESYGIDSSTRYTLSALRELTST